MDGEIGLSLKYDGNAWLALRIAEDKGWSVIVRLPSKVRAVLLAEIYTRPTPTKRIHLAAPMRF